MHDYLSHAIRVPPSLVFLQGGKQPQIPVHNLTEQKKKNILRSARMVSAPEEERRFLVNRFVVDYDFHRHYGFHGYCKHPRSRLWKLTGLEHYPNAQLRARAGSAHN